MAFSRQEYWSGMQFPSSEDLPNPGIKLSLPRSRQILYCLSHQGRPDKTFSVKYLVGVKLMDNKRHDLGNFLVVQWLGLITLAAKGLSLIPGELRAHKPWDTAKKKEKERKKIRRKKDRNEIRITCWYHPCIHPSLIEFLLCGKHSHCESPTGKLLWCFPIIVATQLCSNNHHPQKFPGEEFSSYAKVHCIIPLKCPWVRVLPLLLVIISSPQCRGEKKKWNSKKCFNVKK